MYIVQSIFLGAIQGLTEYLPISSSGHLVLFQKLFNLNEEALFFDAMLHLGTVIPVFIIFRKEIMEIIANPFKSKLLGFIILGTIPAALTGLALKDFFGRIFSDGSSLGVGFIFTALVLWLVETRKSGVKKIDSSKINMPIAVGIAQAVAIFPAVSRSGTTIAAGLVSGLDRKFAAKFSFLLAIPAILGASFLELRDVSLAGVERKLFLPIVVGMVTAAVVGYIAIRWMLVVLERKTLKPFSMYTGILGAVILILQLMGKW